MADEHFRAPHSIRRRGFRPAAGWTRDSNDEPVPKNIQAAFEDDKKIVLETEVPHHSKTKALTTTNVTLQRTIEVSNTGDKKVTPPIKIEVDAPTSTKKDLSLQLHLIRNNEVIIITHGYIHFEHNS